MSETLFLRELKELKEQSQTVRDVQFFAIKYNISYRQVQRIIKKLEEQNMITKSKNNWWVVEIAITREGESAIL